MTRLARTTENGVAGVEDGGRTGRYSGRRFSKENEMNSLQARFIAMLAIGCALLAAAPARAHEFSLESVMNAFVAVEPREAHLVVRLPLHLLKTVQVPTTGRELDLANADPAIDRALAALSREISLTEDGRTLVPSRAIGRFSLPSDRSFDRYEDARAHVARPVAPGTSIYADQGYFDAHLTYPIASAASRFAIRTTVAPELKEYLKLAIRYVPQGEPGRAMIITIRSGTVALNPAWYQAASGFAALGIAHILSGADHLLFLLCLLIPLRGWRQIVAIVTAFTVAHSVTLLGAAYGLAPRGAWFPPFVETAIAASIVYMALENIVGANLRRRWLITAIFGLVHGFGFSYGLQEHLQFAGHHLVVSLLSFNVGIEIGQLMAVAVMLPALALVRRVLPARIGTIILSALVAHSGWHWMTERAEVLRKVEGPQLDWAAVATLSRWAVAILLIAGVASFAAKRFRAARHPVAMPLERELPD
jgi:hypothetical protein